MIRRVALAASLALVSAPPYAATYTLEPDYTQGVIRWNHLGFSHPAAQFSQGEGTLEFDRADLAHSSVTVRIPLSSLRTGVPALDEHLRSADFFDTARFPTATFKSTAIETGPDANRFRVVGELSLHGVVRPVTLDVTLVKVGVNPRTNLPTVGFEATTMITRSDFGLGKYVPQVGDDIHVQIINQAVDAKAYAEYLRARAATDAAAGAAAGKDAAPRPK